MRLIDADKLHKEIGKLFPSKMPYDYTEDDNDLGTILCDIGTMIGNQPTVDAEPAVHAHWKNITRMQFADPLDCKRWFECSNCGMQKQQRIDTMDRDNYCPNCGAKMDEGRK